MPLAFLTPSSYPFTTTCPSIQPRDNNCRKIRAESLVQSKTVADSSIVPRLPSTPPEVNKDAHILRLPNELLDKIFGIAPGSSFSDVCRRFHASTHLSRVQCKGIPSQEALNMFRLRNTRYITLAITEKDTPDELEHMVNFLDGQLCELRLILPCPSIAMVQTLQKLHAKSLTALVIDHNRPRDLDQKMAVTVNPPTLREYRFAVSNCLVDVGQSVVPKLEIPDRLVRLSVDFFRSTITQAAMIALTTEKLKLEHRRDLEEISLNFSADQGTQLSDWIHYLQLGLKQSPSLRKLTILLTNNKLEAPSVKTLMTGLAEIHSIQSLTLDLSHNPTLGDAVVPEILDHLPPALTSLELALHNAGLTDVAALKLTQFVKNTKLTNRLVLGLGYNSLSDNLINELQNSRGPLLGNLQINAAYQSGEAF